MIIVVAVVDGLVVSATAEAATLETADPSTRIRLASRSMANVAGAQVAPEAKQAVLREALPVTSVTKSRSDKFTT